ncbi:dipeptidyl aminopeptidase 4 [Dioscorea cayenensis subsp. rotundata]|uniref:Dipeptidyl aminopeptidase 4 n=1 Tax=Dioscorea cayennensis subsp. rotundata TaxID=55577 RepID=A0AB40CYK6_DIOCR|nr:dipeptidyl aminopeptidase 4 [Dioscorea cayenensis subsp. rotundata]
MQASSSASESTSTKTKKPRIDGEMPLTDANDDSFLFPVEEIVQYPLPGYVSPSCISFSPDDRFIGFLFSPDASLYRKVFLFDLQSRSQEMVFSPPEGGGLDESNLSAEEKLRRERSRERGLGVTRYEWRARNPTASGGLGGHSIMVPLPSGIFFQEIAGGEPELKLLSVAGSPIIDPHLSPDGSMLAYVKDDELHVLHLSNGEAKQLSFGARGNAKTHGLAEYIAQEEMDRKAGFWWSPDSKYIAFTEVDSSEIPLFRIMHQGKDSVGPDAQEDHAYPFAGASNVKVRIGVVSISDEQVTWMDLLCGKFDGVGSNEYLARVNWMPDNTLIAQVLNRSHSTLKILKFDIWTGKKEVIMEENQDVWINLHDCFTPLDKGINKITHGFVWASDRTGFRHLYLYDKNGICLGPITEGDWMVEQIVGVNDNAGLIYFTGTMDGPLESNLYCTSLFPDWNLPLQPPQKLTHEKGRHTVILDHQMQKFVDVHDSLNTPPRVLLCSLHDGSLILPLYEQPLPIPRFKKLQLVPPEIVQLSAKDGTVLYGALYKPDVDRFGPPPYKTLINVYGGPSIQLVCDSWMNTVDMRAQYLRNKGILVWKLDNRGTARRGLKFESHLKKNFGRVDAEDQLTGADWLVKQGLAQAGRIGLYGWSYGGFLSAMSLARYPDSFRCAVSGAPVTSWDGYDTFYTEKYMNTPKESPECYKNGSIMQHVHRIKGKLLLVHGMIDENVHFRHTVRLVNALIDAGKPYELLVFPDERHMPRRLRDRVYMEERIWEFIERNL